MKASELSMRCGLSSALLPLSKVGKAELKPHRIDGSLAFMWESRYVFRPTKFALGAPQLQKGYDAVWDGFRKNFK